MFSFSELFIAVKLLNPFKKESKRARERGTRIRLVKERKGRERGEKTREGERGREKGKRAREMIYGNKAKKVNETSHN